MRSGSAVRGWPCAPAGDTTDYRALDRQEATQSLAPLARTPADSDAILNGEVADREAVAMQRAVGYNREGRTLGAARAVQYAGPPQTADVGQEPAQ